MSAKKTKNSDRTGSLEDRAVDVAALAGVAHQVHNRLAFHHQLGITGYPATPELRRLFVQEQAAPSAAPPPSRPPAAVAPVTDGKSAARQLAAIARDLANCRSCAGDGDSKAMVAGRGSATPRLFIIGDYCRAEAGQHGAIWGLQEDELFWKMMAAIGLAPETVYVSNCIKCGQPEGFLANPQSEHACLAFLERELAAIQPQLICTMGELAASWLLKSRAPLVRLRGRFHQYRYPHGSSGRVMPTYHPRFLLDHPEMKRAAWLDLQALQRNLPGT